MWLNLTQINETNEQKATETVDNKATVTIAMGCKLSEAESVFTSETLNSTVASLQTENIMFTFRGG